MPGRGKKRGRTSDITPESPEAKKRVKEKLTGKGIIQWLKLFRWQIISEKM